MKRRVIGRKCKKSRFITTHATRRVALRDLALSQESMDGTSDETNLSAGYTRLTHVKDTTLML